MNTKSCFAPAHILLPSEQIPLEKWGCIACDQFTSDREYWQRAKEAADGSPSTLNLMHALRRSMPPWMTMPGTC